ncbi:hypothetical protein [Pelagibius marinus]|uniref:hypothetical protein n=1 Tax=Pelagibius marinus TaxID=2762760 RepID=UPI0018732630|nr:hypothetical protein [Pelagibius marinus]
MVERGAENAAELVVDEVTEAFLTLKKERFARGQLDLSGPLTEEDLEALGQPGFDRIKRLLDK